MPDDSSLIAMNIIVTGKVQGVFFRSSMKAVADENHLVGWVRNLPDGNVEAIVQGREKDVLKIVEWCKKGPDRAKVEKIESRRIDVVESYRNFAILY